MAIKSGELIHVGNQVLVDRAQTAGPGQLNVPTEKIYELGNYQSVATIRDIPDLSFSLDSLDVSAEIESMLLGKDFAAMADGTELLMANVLPLDVASQFKAGRTAASPFDVVASVAIPYLVCDSIAYNFGVAANSHQVIGLKGDSVFYASASAWVQNAVGTATASQTVLLVNTALPYNGDTVNGVRYALGVSLKSGKRLALGTDYTESATGAGPAKTSTITVLAPVPVTDSIRIIYQSDVVASYPQASHAVASATRPAAIKGRDIEIKIGGRLVTDRWSSVQTVTCDWKVTLDKNEEFGNHQLVSQDFDVPAVTGAIDIKPRDVAELLKRVRQIANIATTTEVVGPTTSQPLTLEIILHSPETGAILKTLWVPDARFTLPGFSATANTKVNTTFNYESDSGVLAVYKGAKP